MPISSVTRIIRFPSSSASTFAFAFMVFADSDVVVLEINNATGATQTMVLNTDYTVALNVNQVSYPGGTITLLAGALAAGLTLVITSGIPQTQNTDLTNSGGFYPEVITMALDRLTALIQQMQQQLNRAMVEPPQDPTTINMTLPPVQARAGMLLGFDDTGAPTAATQSGIIVGYGETIATAGQTVFTVPAYILGANNLMVCDGGLLLTNGLDYTETSNVSITLTQAAAAGEVYTFRAIN